MAVELEDVTFIRETDAAILINYDDVEYWLPFSQVKKITRNAEPNEDTGVILISDWIAEKKGII